MPDDAVLLANHLPFLAADCDGARRGAAAAGRVRRGVVALSEQLSRLLFGGSS